MIPKIKGPKHHDFHDSSLIDISVGPHLDSIKIVVSTPDESLWLIDLGGVLRFEYETLGTGAEEEHNIPLEIYDIYIDEGSEEQNRWAQRLRVLGVDAKNSKKVFHVVLASSFVRGWGKNKESEGINIICRTVSVYPAPEHYHGAEYSRPTIEAGIG